MSYTNHQNKNPEDALEGIMEKMGVKSNMVLNFKISNVECTKQVEDFKEDPLQNEGQNIFGNIYVFLPNVDKDRSFTNESINSSL